MTQNEIYLSMVLLGQLLPPLTDIINKHFPSAKVRFWTSLVVASIFSVMVNIDQIRFGSVEEALITSLILWTSGQAGYQQWYEGSLWQNNIRFNNSKLPLKQLLPPVSAFPFAKKEADNS